VLREVIAAVLILAISGLSSGLAFPEWCTSSIVLVLTAAFLSLMLVRRPGRRDRKDGIAQVLAFEEPSTIALRESIGRASLI
jgi:hypothetical protein